MSLDRRPEEGREPAGRGTGSGKAKERKFSSLQLFLIAAAVIAAGVLVANLI